jgi:hypothetical protein
MSSNNNNNNQTLNNNINDLMQTIQKERRVFEASLNLFKQLKDATAKDQCEAAMIESQKRLTFLESRLKELQLASNGDNNNNDGNLLSSSDANNMKKSKSSLNNLNDIAEALGGANVSGLHLIGSSPSGPVTNWGNLPLLRLILIFSLIWSYLI